MIKIEVLKVAAVVGCRSLVGVNKDLPAPYSFGNYFSLDTEPELRVLNFWAENLTAAVKSYLLDGQVQVRVYSWDSTDSANARAARCCIIDDERIPANWYNNKMCYTGFGLPPAEVARHIYDYVGDPDNEYEHFTDPEMYYAKRGQYYRKGSNVISACPGITSTMLVADLAKERKVTMNNAANKLLNPKEVNK